MKHRPFFAALAALLVVGCGGVPRQIETVVGVQMPRNLYATGFVVAHDGPETAIIATCFHVAYAARMPILVRWYDGTLGSASVVYGNPARDIALLAVHRDDWIAPVDLGSREDARVDLPLTAHGHAHGVWRIWTKGWLVRSEETGVLGSLWVCNGFSGGPVFHGTTDRVIGMVRAMGRDAPIWPPPGSEAVLMVPSWLISESLEEWRTGTPQHTGVHNGS